MEHETGQRSLEGHPTAKEEQQGAGKQEMFYLQKEMEAGEMAQW